MFKENERERKRKRRGEEEEEKTIVSFFCVGKLPYVKRGIVYSIFK